mmetsp:Transcript_27581/g.74599  ORF Transcript_27581/g.74599 Transcript_27581/m.74599 type:complete len:218 (+) Transcript_27581:128-781(+)
MSRSRPCTTSPCVCSRPYVCCRPRVCDRPCVCCCPCACCRSCWTSGRHCSTSSRHYCCSTSGRGCCCCRRWQGGLGAAGRGGVLGGGGLLAGVLRALSQAGCRRCCGAWFGLLQLAGDGGLRSSRVGRRGRCACVLGGRLLRCSCRTPSSSSSSSRCSQGLQGACLVPPSTTWCAPSRWARCPWSPSRSPCVVRSLLCSAHTSRHLRARWATPRQSR